MSSEPTPEQSSTMSETTETQQQQQPSPESLTQKMEKVNISSSSFSIWPPTDRTRAAVINRLIETLSTPSVLSKRYGTLPPDEASSAAHSIEVQAFSAASVGSGSGTGSVDEGIEILQVYSKEISKRVIDTVKSRADSAAAGGDGAVAATDVAGGPAEEVGSGDVSAAKEEVTSSAAAAADADNESST